MFSLESWFKHADLNSRRPVKNPCDVDVWAVGQQFNVCNYMIGFALRVTGKSCCVSFKGMYILYMFYVYVNIIICVLIYSFIYVLCIVFMLYIYTYIVFYLYIYIIFLMIIFCLCYIYYNIFFKLYILYILYSLYYIVYIYTCDVQCPMCGCLNSRQVALLLGCHKVVLSMSKRRISLVLQVVLSPSKLIKRSSGKSHDFESKMNQRGPLFLLFQSIFIKTIMGFHIFFFVHNHLYPLSVLLFETVSTSARNEALFMDN